MKHVLQILCVVGLAIACGEEEKPTPVIVDPLITPVGTPVGNPTTKTIGSSGGSISSEDGIMQLTIPAGALAGDTEISIQPVTNEDPGGIGLSYNLLPDGTTFSKTAALTFHYTDEDVKGIDQNFLYIAYQDETNAWISDLKNLHLDSIAQTLSLDINHFTIFSLGDDYPRIVASPDVLKSGETSSLHVVETVVLAERADGTATHIQTEMIPNEIVKEWKVNFNVGGSPQDGTIEGSGALVTYRAPAQVDERRTVKVSAYLNIRTFTGRRGDRGILGFSPSVEITLEPTEFNYKVVIDYVDSTISPFYGGLKAGVPVYNDKATFDLKIRIKNNVRIPTISNIQNHSPTVTPPVKGFQGNDFIWIPDSIGKVNVVDVVGNSITTPGDSVLVFDIHHKKTYSYGIIMQSSEDGTVNSRTEPVPYGGSIGFPMVFEVDLRKRNAHFDSSQPEGNFGTNISVYIMPQE